MSAKKKYCQKNVQANIVLPRHIIMYLCRSLTDKPLADIGKRIGGRDYTTVINALDSINKKYKEDIKVKNTMIC